MHDITPLYMTKPNNETTSSKVVRYDEARAGNFHFGQFLTQKGSQNLIYILRNFHNSETILKYLQFFLLDVSRKYYIVFIEFHLFHIQDSPDYFNCCKKRIPGL